MSSETTSQAPVEFSRPFRLAELGDVPTHQIDLEASAAERDALAARYEIVALDRLTAQLTVQAEAAGDVLVTGDLQAEVVQECVVTLEPVIDTIESAFDQRFTTAPLDLAGDVVIGPDDIEPPEPIAGDSIDLGELVAQFLSLAINPYPRAPAADEQAGQFSPDAAKDGPFAVLAQLRNEASD